MDLPYSRAESSNNRWGGDFNSISTSAAVALAARVKRAGEEFIGDLRELFLLDEQMNEWSPYERLLADAMAGKGALFAREGCMEAAWSVAEPVLREHSFVEVYEPGSWGPMAADGLIERDGGWHNPVSEQTV